MGHVMHRHGDVGHGHVGGFRSGLRGGCAEQQPHLHEQAGQQADPDPGMCPDHQKSPQKGKKRSDSSFESDPTLYPAGGSEKIIFSCLKKLSCRICFGGNMKIAYPGVVYIPKYDR